jgi:hypothetical protein
MLILVPHMKRRILPRRSACNRLAEKVGISALRDFPEKWKPLLLILGHQIVIVKDSFGRLSRSVTPFSLALIQSRVYSSTRPKVQTKLPSFKLPPTSASSFAAVTAMYFPCAPRSRVSLYASAYSTYLSSPARASA